MKLIFWNGRSYSKKWRKWEICDPCPCGCDYRITPNLKKYLIGGLFFGFGFTLMFEHNETKKEKSSQSRG